MACCLTNFSVSCARGCCSIGRRLDLSLSESSVRPMQFLRYMSIMLLFESSRSSASLKKLCCRLCCVRMAPVCHGKCSEAYSRYISLRPETWLLGRPANGSAITPAPPPPGVIPGSFVKRLRKGQTMQTLSRAYEALRNRIQQEHHRSSDLKTWLMIVNWRRPLKRFRLRSFWNV